MRNKLLVGIGLGILLTTSMISTPSLSENQTVLAQTNLFTDIPMTHVYQKEIYDMRSKSIINGYEDGTFKPNDAIQKRHAAALILRYLTRFKNNVGKLPVNTQLKPNDMKPSNAYYKEVLYLVQRGLLTLDANGNVNPTKDLTRGEMAHILATVYELPVKATYVFGDVIGTKYVSAVQAIYSNGITTGYEDNSFRVDASLTRAHYTLFMYRSMHVDKNFVAQPIQPVIVTPQPEPTPTPQPTTPPVVETPAPTPQPTPPPASNDGIPAGYSYDADPESGKRLYPGRTNLVYRPLPETAVPKEKQPFTIVPIDNQYGYGLAYNSQQLREWSKHPPFTRDMNAYERRANELIKSNQFNRIGSLSIGSDYHSYDKTKEKIDILAKSIGVSPAEFVAAWNYVWRTGNFYNGGRYYMYADYENRRISTAHFNGVIFVR